MLNISKVEEYEIMLNKKHNLHNKLILCTFLTVEDRGAVALAMLAITKGKLPTNLKISSVIEVIINCPDDVINTLIELFEISEFFTSENALAQIKQVVESDESLVSLRPCFDRGNLDVDGQNNEGDLVDNS